MKRRIFFFIFFIFFSVILKGQDYYVIDSLKQELIQNSDQDQVLLSLAWEYRKSHPDSSLYYLREILSKIEQEESSPIYPQVLNFTGVAYHYKGNDAEAFSYYNRAYEAAVNLPDSLQVAHALNNLGRFYALQADFIKAYEIYSQAIQIFEQIDDKSSMSYGYKSLSELYVSQKNYAKALEMAQKTLDLRKEVDNVAGQISVLNHIAEIYLAQNDFTSAIGYYEQSMMLASGLQDKAMMANSYLGISEAYCQQDQFSKAYDEAVKAERIAAGLQNQDLLNRVNLLKGKILFRLNRIGESERYFDDLMLEVSNSGDLEIEKEARYYLALLYKSTGRYEQAFDQFQKHHELASALENAEHARLIERLEARIQIEHAEQEKRILAAEKAAAEASEDSLRLQNILLIGGIMVAMIIMTMLFLVNKKRQKTNLKLIQKNKYIAEQRAEIQNQNEYIAAQNEELKQGNERLKNLNNEKDTLMNILAHDLKAPFNRIKGLVQLMELSEINDEQKKYVELLDGSANNGLALIRDLLEVSAFSGKEKQPVFQNLSLMKQLTEKKESFQADAAAKHIDILIDMKEDVHLPADPSYLSRILDNLISNAIKFSEPGKRIILSGGQENDAAFISVKDFGPGFSKKDKKSLYNKFARLSAQPTAGESSNGLGLAIVKMLVESLKGEIELISEPGQGSEFIVRFPLNQAHEDTLKKGVS